MKIQFNEMLYNAIIITLLKFQSLKFSLSKSVPEKRHKVYVYNFLIEQTLWISFFCNWNFSIEDFTSSITDKI